MILRVQIVDGEKVVIGIGPPEERSEHGFLIESRVLANLLNNEFMKIWNNAKKFEDHIETVILRYVNVSIHYERLRELVKRSLNVPNSRMAEELISMLLEKKSLLKIDHEVYNFQVVKEACEQTSYIPEKLSEFMYTKYHISIPNNLAKKIIASIKDSRGGVVT